LAGCERRVTIRAARSSVIVVTHESAHVPRPTFLRDLPLAQSAVALSVGLHADSPVMLEETIAGNRHIELFRVELEPLRELPPDPG
jgi:hypothetical protein